MPDEPASTKCLHMHISDLVCDGPACRRAHNLSFEDLQKHIDEITEFLSTSRPCDELSTIRDQLGNVIASRNAEAPALVIPADSADSRAASAAAVLVPEDCKPCCVRVRMDDGTQVTENFTSTQTVQVCASSLRTEKDGLIDIFAILEGFRYRRPHFVFKRACRDTYCTRVSDQL